MSKTRKLGHGNGFVRIETKRKDNPDSFTERKKRRQEERTGKPIVKYWLKEWKDELVDVTLEHATVYPGSDDPCHKVEDGSINHSALDGILAKVLDQKSERARRQAFEHWVSTRRCCNTGWEVHSKDPIWRSGMPLTVGDYWVIEIVCRLYNIVGTRHERKDGPVGGACNPVRVAHIMRRKVNEVLPLIADRLRRNGHLDIAMKLGHFPYPNGTYATYKGSRLAKEAG